MKKTLSMILALCMALALLSGCGTQLTASQPTEAPSAADPAGAPAAADTGYDVSALEPITFKFAYGTSSELTDKAHEMAADRIEELSNGKITVERYLQGQLYTADADGAIMVSDGTCQMIIMGDMMALNAAPEICGWTQVPFIFGSPEQCTAFWQQVGDAVNEKLSEVYGVRALWDSIELRGPRVICANKPMLCADDFKGAKFRLPSTAATVAAFEAMGVSALTSSWSEVYQVMQTGIAEAVESPLSNFKSISIYEVCKYCMQTNHTYAFRAAHVNEAWWDGLAPVYQDIIKQALSEAFTWYTEQELRGDDAILELFAENGMTVYRRDEIDIDSIKSVATEAIIEKYKDSWDMSYYELIQNL